MQIYNSLKLLLRGFLFFTLYAGCVSWMKHIVESDKTKIKNPLLPKKQDPFSQTHYEFQNSVIFNTTIIFFYIITCLIFIRIGFCYSLPWIQQSKWIKHKNRKRNIKKLAKLIYCQKKWISLLTLFPIASGISSYFLLKHMVQRKDKKSKTFKLLFSVLSLISLPFILFLFLIFLFIWVELVPIV